MAKAAVPHTGSMRAALPLRPFHISTQSPRGTMNCQECGGDSKVISCRDVLNMPGAKCRYRACVGCHHRWYSLVPAESALPHDAVSWVGSGVRVGVNRRQVECIETGARYSTVQEVAKTIHVSRASVYKALSEGMRIHGQQYRWTDTAQDSKIDLSNPDSTPQKP